MKRPVRTNIFGLISVLAVLFSIDGTNANAQEEDGFRLGAITSFCYPGHPGPFIGCTPWEGVTISVESVDGEYADTCTTVTDPYNEPPRYASCTFFVPFGSTITASIDPAAIPDGYYLASGQAVQEWDIPDAPPTGLFGGPTFILYPVEGDTGDDELPADDEVVEELPSTGAGPGISGPVSDGAAMVVMGLLLMIVLCGVRVVKRLTP